MKLFILFLFSSFAFTIATAQFSPDGGQPGSIAIHKDSVEWLGFATSVDLAFGWYDVADTTLGRIDFTVPNACVGFPDFEAQPLGDGGIATVTFEAPFSNRLGYDFVVFENGFATSDTTGFFELAFVEVSSNGVDFFRFPSTSLSTPADFAGPFAELDSRLIDGLAGRFSAPYGAPFDLSDLPAEPLLDLGAITHVRVVDVIGTEDSAFAKTDSDGMAIVDPYPTAYVTGGFDLDAVGILGNSVSSIPAEPLTVSHLSATLAIRKGQQLNDVHEATVWIDALGAATHRGACSPEIGGFYILKTPGKNEKWKRVFVY